jgi:peptidyl-prolyl cis-trans isomerase SurA
MTTSKSRPQVNSTFKVLNLLFSFLFLAAAAYYLASPINALAATTVDRIVAQVNNEIITLSDLQARIKSMPPEMKSSLPPGANLELEVLNYMIEIELINQVARRMGIMISEQEVDANINAIKEENNLTDAQLEASLKKNGQSLKDFRANLKFEILKDLVLRENIIRKIVIPDQEVEAFLRGEGPQGISSQYFLGIGGEVKDSDKVKLIFLASDPSKAAEVMKKALSIRKEIEAGLPFSEAAIRYSEGPGAKEGGDPGLTVGEMQSQLQTLARSLTPGQVSQPLDGGAVVLLMLIEPSTPASSSTPKANSDEKQVFTPEQYQAARRQLEQLKLREKYSSWLEELKSKANIKIML